MKTSFFASVNEKRQSKHCGFCNYLFDNSFDQSQYMVRLVREEKMVLSGLVFAELVCAGQYWAVLGCTELYWVVLGGTRLYWAVLDCTGRY